MWSARVREEETVEVGERDASFMGMRVWIWMG